VDAKGQLEYEIVLKTKPASNKITLALDFPDGLMFAYQDTLENDYKNGVMVDPGQTLAEYLAGTTRPKDVEGSYAVYWKKRNNQYRTGKFCHIYRPTATDDNSNETYCNIAIVGKTLTIEMPQAWLDGAVFPVVVDPTLGYNTVGGTVGGNSDRSYANFGGTVADDTVSLTGEITVLHFYHQANWTSGETMYIGLYDESGSEPNNVVGQTTALSVNGAAWSNWDVSGEDWGVTNGNDYYVSANAAVNPSGGAWTYDTGVTGAGSWYYAAAGPLQDPWPVAGDNWLAGVFLSMYADYAAVGGGGLEMELAMHHYRMMRE
jgi:hypothetical protein